MSKDFLNQQVLHYQFLREVFFSNWQNDGIEVLKTLSQNFSKTPFADDILSINGDKLDEARWDYNRLFVGPSKPLASTFESVHLSDKNLLMQSQTFEVREFYDLIGLKVKNQNHIPDDFIGYEYEFLYCLSLISLDFLNDKEKFDESMKIRKEFIQKHQIPWIDKFCEDIKINAKEDIWINLSDFIKSVLEKEREFFAI